MDKKDIFELKDYILNKILYFCEYYLNENISSSNYSNWIARDVIGHINSWVKFSGYKLESIKLNKSFEDVSNIDSFNKINYENNKNKSLEKIINESKIILEKYNGIIDLYNENELLSNDFSTGFSFALWKYMAMDLGIHPIMHILQYYLKKMDYKEFINEIEDSKKYFMEYSGNNILEYNFNEYFENKDEKINRFNELNKVNDNEYIKEIIKINIVQ